MSDQRLTVTIPAIPESVIDLVFPDGTEIHETNAVMDGGEPAFQFVVSNPDGITLDDLEWRT